MKKKFKFLVLFFCTCLSVSTSAKDLFPDGSIVPDWFRQTELTDINQLGKQYCITDYGIVNDSTLLQKDKIQSVIDKAYQNGGGVIIIPKGTFLTGSLFFKPNTHLYIEKDGTLKGSDDISDFDILTTRMEGQTLQYFAALVNADNVDGFTVSGEGCINGNGLRFWKSFWLRRKFNPKCTNMDEMRPRLLYISNCKDVQVSGLHLMNSPFWTTHFYKCENVKLLNLDITSPSKPVRAPSTDAVDIDVCTNFLIKNCYMNVNDDAVALKGGKGPNADKDENNGANRNIIIEDCKYGSTCHSTLTCGSESILNHNVILRRSTSYGASIILHLKMRPDTPQHYEYILVEDIKGSAKVMLSIKPWNQFFDLKGEKDIKLSYANDIVLRNIELECNNAFGVEKSDQYKLSNFVFENMDIKTEINEVDKLKVINNCTLNKVIVNGKKYK